MRDISELKVAIPLKLIVLYMCDFFFLVLTLDKEMHSLTQQDICCFHHIVTFIQCFLQDPAMYLLKLIHLIKVSIHLKSKLLSHPPGMGPTSKKAK